MRTTSRVIALEAVEVGYNVTDTGGDRLFVGTRIESLAHLTDERYSPTDA